MHLRRKTKCSIIVKSTTHKMLLPIAVVGCWWKRFSTDVFNILHDWTFLENSREYILAAVAANDLCALFLCTIVSVRTRSTCIVKCAYVYLHALPVVPISSMAMECSIYIISIPRHMYWVNTSQPDPLRKC